MPAWCRSEFEQAPIEDGCTWSVDGFPSVECPTHLLRRQANGAASRQIVGYNLTGAEPSEPNWPTGDPSENPQSHLLKPIVLAPVSFAKELHSGSSTRDCSKLLTSSLTHRSDSPQFGSTVHGHEGLECAREWMRTALPAGCDGRGEDLRNCRKRGARTRAGCTNRWRCWIDWVTT